MISSQFDNFVPRAILLTLCGGLNNLVISAELRMRFVGSSPILHAAHRKNLKCCLPFSIITEMRANTIYIPHATAAPEPLELPPQKWFVLYGFLQVPCSLKRNSKDADCVTPIISHFVTTTSQQYDNAKTAAS